MIYYTGGLYLGHPTLPLSHGVFFGSREELDECLIRNWNRVVGEEDMVCILGGLLFRGCADADAENYLARLSGRKLLIEGECSWMSGVELFSHFDAVMSRAELYDSGIRVRLSCGPASAKQPFDGIDCLVCGRARGVSRSKRRSDVLLLSAAARVNNYAPATLAQLMKNNCVLQCD